MITLARWEGCGPGPTAPGKLDDDDNDKDDNDEGNCWGMWKLNVHHLEKLGGFWKREDC